MFGLSQGEGKLPYIIKKCDQIICPYFSHPLAPLMYYCYFICTFSDSLFQWTFRTWERCPYLSSVKVARYRLHACLLEATIQGCTPGSKVMVTLKPMTKISWKHCFQWNCSKVIQKDYKCYLMMTTKFSDLLCLLKLLQIQVLSCSWTTLSCLIVVKLNCPTVCNCKLPRNLHCISRR